MLEIYAKLFIEQEPLTIFSMSHGDASGGSPFCMRIKCAIRLNDLLCFRDG